MGYSSSKYRNQHICSQNLVQLSVLVIVWGAKFLPHSRTSKKKMLSLSSWSHHMTSSSPWICWVSHRTLTCAENLCWWKLSQWQIWELQYSGLQKQKFIRYGSFKIATITALHKAEKDAKTFSRRVMTFLFIVLWK